MSLYKRGGKYTSYICINNVRYARALGTGNKQEAVRREIEFRNELDARRSTKSNLEPEMRFAELATRFLGSGLATPYSTDRVKKLIRHFGDTPLNEIGKPLANEYRRMRVQTEKVTDATVDHDLGVFRRVLFYALDEGILLSNPLSRVRMSGLRRVRRPVLSLEEEPLLIEAAAAHVKPLIISGLDTGMRRGELFSQLAEDVDLYQKTLAVTHSKTRGGELRIIPLTGRMVTLLSTMPRKGLIFTFRAAKLETLRGSWWTAIRNSGIRPIQFKQLRHTFNTRLMCAGVIEDVRMELMGHSQGRPRSTNSIYTHIDLPILRQAIRRLEDWTAEQLKEIDRQRTEQQQLQAPSESTH